MFRITGDKEILEQNGWFIECQSPFEIRHIDGDVATGQAARIVVDSLEKEFNPNKVITFNYKNWKDELSVRKVVPEHIWFGSTDFHKDEQWLMSAIDIEKKAKRDFALNDILEFIKTK